MSNSVAAAYDSRIYKAAKSGTPVNKGVPDQLARLIVAQARHESGDYLSNGFKTGNNAFGYVYVKGAPYQLSSPGIIADNKQPLAKYASVEDSVKEIVDWIYRRRREGDFPADLSVIDSPEKYAMYLKSSGYYGDSQANYTAGLKRNLSVITLSPSSSSNALAIGLLVAAALTFTVFAIRNRK